MTCTRTRASLRAVIAGLAVLVACTSSQAATPISTTSSSSTTTRATTPPSTTETIDPPSDDPWIDIVPGKSFEGTLLGLSTGLSRAEREPRWDALEADAGRTYDIGHVFHAWDKAIPTADDEFHLADGRLLMISWNGTDTIEIADGVHDDWITSQAAAVRDLDRRVLLRWFWEMDGRRRLPVVHSGPDYVRAWLHIREIFDDVGATNAEFVWCPNDFLFRDGDPDVWYPGDEHVDWLCADGYNWADSTTSDEWLGIDEIFRAFHDWAAPRGLPIVIAETGVGEAEAGAKAEWIRSIPELLESTLPEIDALVWFDKDFTEFGHRDWRVDTSDSAYEAWLEISADPWLNPLDR